MLDIKYSFKNGISGEMKIDEERFFEENPNSDVLRRLLSYCKDSDLEFGTDSMNTLLCYIERTIEVLESEERAKIESFHDEIYKQTRLRKLDRLVKKYEKWYAVVTAHTAPKPRRLF